jgi:cyclopropane-fatty-acyl-phospholipid synthase
MSVQASEKIAHELLRRIQFGSLTIMRNGREVGQYGDQRAQPSATLKIHDPAFFSRVLRYGELGLGESYVEGLWDIEDDKVADFLGILLLNRIQPALSARLLVGLFALGHNWRHRPYVKNSMLNASFHYDLSNEFFRLVLDESMTYSCGFQKNPDDSLKTMQLQKHELICKKLELQPDDMLLDIGCGWGELVMTAARKYGVRCLGVTASAAQASWAEKRATAAGLSDRLKIKLQDYRDIEGDFNKVVSVGMFEHVGRPYWHDFMAKLSRLLRPGGTGLLHTIGTIESRLPGPWLRRYIFPGTHLPRLEDLAEATGRHELVIGHLENWRPHYAVTAEKWTANFVRNRELIGAVDRRFDQSFLRGWMYYLQLLVASFRYGPLQVYQLVYCHKRFWSLPSRMDYHNTNEALPR